MKNEDPPPHHEESDISPALVPWTAGGFVVVLIVIFIVVWWMFRYYLKIDESENVARTNIGQPSQLPPPPRLQVDPNAEYQDYLSSQMEVLNTYGWASREEGRARIPIERAMKLVAEGGLPAQSSGGKKQ